MDVLSTHPAVETLPCYSISAPRSTAVAARPAGSLRRHDCPRYPALLAWVKENNPKQYIKEGRLDKTRQPKGDPDCKLGIKKRHNTAPAETADARDATATPTTDAKPASRLQVGVDIFWGYASDIVVTALPDGTEVVLAERTRPFNESDPSMAAPFARVCGVWAGSSRSQTRRNNWAFQGGFDA